MRLLVVASLFTLVSVSAFAGGYEKAIMTSAKYGGVGGAATAIVNDAESLYFNPAGLAAIDGLTATGNFDPTLSKFKGPFNTTTATSVESDQSFSPVFSAVAGLKPIDKLGIGLGAYVAGATKAVYSGVDVGLPQKADVVSDLNVVEFALGGGYELLDGLRLGAAWRLSMVKARLATVSGTSNLDIDNLSTTSASGARLGVQYGPRGSSWGLGAHWRTQVPFTATGTATSKSLTSGATINLGDGSATNVFPHQVSVGGFYDVTPKTWRLVAEWTWTEYLRDDFLEINIATGRTGITQNWQNQSNYRLGSEYMLGDWALRGGYVLTTQVVPKDKARPTFSSPGLGHTIALGAGTKFMGGMLGVNAALEYSFAGGTVDPNDGGIAGDYTSSAMVAHVGVTYSL